MRFSFPIARTSVANHLANPRKNSSWRVRNVAVEGQHPAFFPACYWVLGSNLTTVRVLEGHEIFTYLPSSKSEVLFTGKPQIPSNHPCTMYSPKPRRISTTRHIKPYWICRMQSPLRNLVQPLTAVMSSRKMRIDLAIQVWELGGD